MYGDDVLGHAQSDARSANLRGVHVAVDPYRRARLVGIAPDGQERYCAPLGARPQGRYANDFRVVAGPGFDLVDELGIIQVFGTKHVFICPGELSRPSVTSYFP